MTNSCLAKIRPLHDKTIEIHCYLPLDSHTLHIGVLRDYAFVGSRTSIHWADGDRRNYRGDFMPCVAAPCVLPDGHYGLCAQ